MLNNDKNLYLVDGHALCYRAFYAIKDLSNSKGMPTNAIYGAIMAIKKVIKQFSPNMMAVVFDSKGKTGRHEKYKEYKIQRKPMPDELSLQIPLIMDVIQALNIPIFQIAGYEADDIIATIARRAEKKGMVVTIVTSDKDALQLVDDNVKVLNPSTPDYKLYDARAVEEKFGVGPGSIVDLMALMGDQSDNIPGVKGVGQVTAEKLIRKFGSLSELYKNLDKIDKESLKAKLEEGRQMAELSRELIALDTNVPLEFMPSKAELGAADTGKLIELFREFEFDSLLKELVPVEEDASGKYSALGDEKGAAGLKSRIEKKGQVSFTLVTGELAKLKGVAFSVEEKEASFVPYGSDKALDSIIKDVFEDKGVKKISHDMKDSISILQSAAIDMRNPYFDTMIADYLVDPSRAGYDIAAVSMRRLGHILSGGGKEGVDWDKNGQASLKFGAEQTYIPECEKSDIALRLYGRLSPALREKGLEDLFYGVEMPLVSILADMERTGVAIDRGYVEKKSAVIAGKLEDMGKDIYVLAGEEFNINSPKQLRGILYEKLKLPVGKKTKTGASTDESVLRKLADAHPLPKKLLEYRELSKLQATYYEAIKNLVCEDGRLRARFNQAVTSTGRLSSSEPNLQNIPIKTPLGREIRKAFIPGKKSHVLIAADYSQIELRILAHLSGDDELSGAFRRGEDVHSYTASKIFNCRLNDVTEEMRAAAKTVNFGIVYGMSSFGLSKDLGMPVKEAQEFIDAYFSRYERVKKYIDDTISSARQDGFVTTLLNRRRYIPEINSPNEHIRGFAERMAVNTPVQGSAADLIKLAMIRCFKEITGPEVKMLIQVHDELVFEAPRKELESVAVGIKGVMENIMSLAVPLVVHVEAGDNWLEMEKIRF